MYKVNNEGSARSDQQAASQIQKHTNSTLGKLTGKNILLTVQDSNPRPLATLHYVWML